MRDCRERGQSWRKIASRFEQIAPATLLRIYRDRYEPKRNKTRVRLGLPALAAAPVCPKCGVVHSRTCRVLPEWVNQAADWLAERQKWRAAHAGELAAVVEWAEGYHGC